MSEAPSPPYTAAFRIFDGSGSPAFLIAFYNEDYTLPNPGDSFNLGEAGSVKVLSVHRHRDADIIPFYDIIIKQEETS